MAQNRLVGDIIPLNYRITIDTNMKSFRYKGNEIITVAVKKPLLKIPINAIEIDFVSAKVRCKGHEQIAKATVNAKSGIATLAFTKPISGRAELEIEFTGKNNDEMAGFYRSKYGKGKNRSYLLTTQFEATDARRAFPCFDEPALKATFDLTLIIDDKLEAVSNMPVKGTRRMENGRKYVSFLTTPRMSTYLLYMGVGRYERLAGNAGKLKVSVLTMPGMKKYAKLPLEYAISAIKYYERYFGIRYPLPKVDLLAIPDFAAGAMENWGAVTFRETALLVDENSSVATKQYVADVVAHELAHQWFGDLVTMKWWDDLWLNESFATFMSAKAVDAAFPEWNFMAQYIDDTIGTAFSADCLKSTHPINVEVKSPGEIDQIFDRISYEKGGTVLHMLEDFVGKEQFRKGLNAYLKTHAYSNATKYDLWNAIAKASRNSSFSTVAKAWIDKTGYPSVLVEEGQKRFKLRQQRFTLLENASNEVWPIPLHYIAASGSGTMLISQRTSSIKTDSDWIKLNYGQAGLYRTEYSKDMLKKVGELISKRKLSDIDAWGIENDFFALARSGRRKLAEYLAFIDAYLKNVGYPANVSVLGHLNWLIAIATGTKFEDSVKKMTIAYSIPLLSRLGWHTKKGEGNIDTILRGMTISSLGIAGHKPTIDKALSLFSMFMKGKAIESNIRSAVYAIAARNGNADVYNFFLKRYKSENEPEEQRRSIQVLGAFSDAGLLGKALKLSLSNEVRLQDSFVIPAVVSSNPFGRSLIWKWSRQNWKTLMKRYASGTHMLARYVDNMGLMYGQEALSELSSFFSRKENRRDDIKRSIAQLLERVEVNTSFMKANGL